MWIFVRIRYNGKNGGDHDVRKIYGNRDDGGASAEVSD
jgi:hypothetical protein